MSWLVHNIQQRDLSQDLLNKFGLNYLNRELAIKAAEII